ncbi:MAG: YitT family protein, partial [Paeniclostridium sordellii]|nr:YitT family protein [Paeniclostridium sordellii]
MRIELKNIGLVVLGASILAFGSYNFNYQNNITEGGVLGLLLLIKNVLNISPSITSLIIDVSLFIIGTKFFGKKFLIYSILSTVTFSNTYKLCENIG